MAWRIPRRLHPHACAFAALLALAASARAIAAAQNDAGDGAPRAVLSEVGHNFGAVEPGGSVGHTFKIRNAGTAPLTIERVEFSEPGLRSRFAGVLQPGEVGAITIVWDITQPSGNLDAQAVIHVSDRSRPRLTYTLTGVVSQSIAMRPSSDVFLTLFPDQGGERVVTIASTESQPLKITGLEHDGHFEADIRTVQEGKTYEVVVRVAPGLEPGRYRESIIVSTNRARLAQLRIGVHIFVKDDLYSNPGAIEFGTVKVRGAGALPAAMFSQSLMLKKRTGDFSIVSIESDVDALRIHRSPSGRSDVFGLVVSIDPDRLDGEERLEGAIRIATDDPKFPLLTIPVRARVQ